MTTILLAILAYLVPTFILGYVWHLKIFETRYKALEIYRDDMIIPFGLASMIIQGVLFSIAYIYLLVPNVEGAFMHALTYFASGALLSWSFTTLAVGAKHKMSPVRGYVTIETAFTIAQWVLVAVATVLIVG